MAKIQFIPYTPNDSLIFAKDLSEFIPEDSPVRLFSEVLDLLDISEVVASYSNGKDGRPAYHPRMLLKVVVYGYFCDIFSTRDLEEAMRRDAHLIWLSAYQRPDHATISRFKSRCAASIKKIFSSLVRVLAERGEIQLSEELYIDGTTIRSRAARRSIKWRSAAERFSAMAQESIDKAVGALLEHIDESERNELVGDGRIECTPQKARELADEVERRARPEDGNAKARKIKARAKAVRDACGRKEAHDRTAELCAGRCGIAPADPECGIMPAKEDGYAAPSTPNYNVQAATQNQYVTNYDVFDTSSDKATAMDFVEECVSENGAKPQAVVADAGYGCEEVYAGLEDMGIEAVVKYQRYDSDTRPRAPKADAFNSRGFLPAPGRDALICPAGREMAAAGSSEKVSKRGFRSVMTKFICPGHCECPFKDKCPAARDKDHAIKRSLGALRHEAKARERLLKPENQERLRRRSLEPEPVFGQIKHNHGYSRFRHFGKAKVRMDLGLMLMAHNLRKLHKNVRKSA